MISEGLEQTKVLVALLGVVVICQTAAIVALFARDRDLNEEIGKLRAAEVARQVEAKRWP